MQLCQKTNNQNSKASIFITIVGREAEGLDVFCKKVLLKFLKTHGRTLELQSVINESCRKLIKK